MSFDAILRGDFRQGFGSYQDPQGGWHPTPLIRFAGETIIRNPVNGATYANDADASGATGPHTVTVFANQVAWDTYLAGFEGDVYAALLNPPGSVEDPPQYPIDPVGGPAELHPDYAAIIEGFYQKYLHRASDPAGLDFWVQVILDGGGNGKANAEQGFITQSINDGIYTLATLPTPTYVTLPAAGSGGSTDTGGGGDSTDDSAGGTTDDSTVPANTAGGGLFDGIQAKIEDVFAGLATSTGLSIRTLEIGAVALGIGALIYFNSDGGTKRKR